jgi:DNA (cytosine-5)-methyltransferase 1
MWFTKAKRAQSNTDFETWIQGGVVPTLNAMDNNGEVFATVLVVAYDEFNDSISEIHHTLRAGTKQSTGVLIIDGTRVNDVRVYEDGIVPTVISRYGTGGGNVPMIFPIDDGRELEKHQNGTGIGEDGAPAYTLDRQQAPAIVAVDFYNASTSNTSQTIRSHTASNVNIGGMMDSQVVRRLTPKECERLQGFPDDWTADQADSNRYKQCGNAVAVPVVEWIISRMVAATN